MIWLVLLTWRRLLKAQGINWFYIQNVVELNLPKFIWWNSQRADNVLKQAQELVKALDEADEAQQKAKDAIKQANEDISLARADLEKVNNEFGISSVCSMKYFIWWLFHFRLTV